MNYPTPNAESQADNPFARDLSRSPLGRMFIGAYRYRACRRYCYRLVLRLEGGELFSCSAREILRKYWGVEVGAYSYGECMIPGIFPARVNVGRYVSIGPGVRVFLRNHPMERLSMHPFFYNAAFGFTSEDLIDSGSLTIGHDSWIGARAIITPSCRRIGIGAVIGAGSVVTRDVADFCVVAGNPAQIIRARFDEGTCDLIRRSRWWERPVAECVHFLEEMIRPLGVKPSLHPLLAPNNRFCTNGTDECGCR